MIVNQSDIVRWERNLTSPELPSTVAAWFAANGSIEQRWKLASNQHLPVDVLFMLANDGEEAVAHAVVANWSTPPDILEFLAERLGDANEAIRSHVNAPVFRQWDMPVALLSQNGLEALARRFKASPEEKAELDRLIEESEGLTVGRAWLSVRGGRSM